MKRRAILICALVSTLFAAAFAATQFYKPNREARLVVSLKNKAVYSAGDPILVTVMLSNQSQEPLLINARMLFNRYPLPGEVSFNIQGPREQNYPLLKAIAPQDIRNEDLAILTTGETMERQVDLNEFYGVRKRGKYKVQVVYYNSVDLEKDSLKTWRGSLASDPTEIELR
jgi:hypothetical protein